MTEPDVDEDGMIAAYDLIRRAGAGSVEVGYLHDDVPVQEADWWANAQFRGVRITVEHRAGPVEAVEALARRLINGATCTYCGHIITISGQPRDGIPTSSWLLLDTDEGSGTWHRTAYDVGVVQAAMEAQGLPERLVARLAYGL